MKISTMMSYAHGYVGATKEIVEMEKAGLDVVWIPEAYSFDGVSAMGYVAAKTDRVTIASGILNIYSRTPTLMAMTAAGVDALSEGRCMLGLGASGPQVIEGFHGVAYDAPMRRIREVVEICRAVWRREEKLNYQGKKYQIPLPAEQGTGLGKPLKIINHPYREEIPIALATLGDKSVEMTAEIADAWLPAFYMPEGAEAVWGDALRRGSEKREPGRPPLDIYAGGTVASWRRPRILPRHGTTRCGFTLAVWAQKRRTSTTRFSVSMVTRKKPRPFRTYISKAKSHRPKPQYHKATLMPRRLLARQVS